MNKLTIAVVLLMAATSAHAGSISFEIEGQKIRIEAPRNCDALSCLKVSAPGFKGFKSSNDDNDVAANPAPANTAPAAAPVQAATPQPAAPVTTTVTAPAAPATTVATAAPSVATDAPSAPAVSTIAPAPASAPAPLAAAPAPAPTTPLGVWATEENKGNVRIEECGSNLCGYAAKSGERILINMRPQDNKWTGRIHDPDSGRNYDSTIAMKGANTLHVQGCAFGGMFCGGQTWKRVS